VRRRILARTLSGKFSRVRSEIEIWRGETYCSSVTATRPARTVRLADALAAVGDREGEAVWRRIALAVTQN
jgi:hypothetical protein